MDVTTLWNGRATLGEGPVWDAERGVLWFVDIKRPLVHRFDPRTGAVESWPAPAPVGWVLPAADGTLLAGLKTGLARFDPATGGIAHLAEVEPALTGNRLNDATVAPDGVVWFGSMDDGERDATGRIYRWDGARAAAAATEPVCITNGPAVSPDGRTLFHVDTVGGVIHMADIGADGALGASRVFARVDPADGHPDGVTADAAGNLWVGLWGGGRARLYAPSGEIVTEVPLPAKRITKVALGGDDLRTAFVTSASIGADPEDEPAAGALFSFRVDVPGQQLPTARIAG